MRFRPGEQERSKVTGRGDERPQHVAEVRALWVGETEVTQGQWKAVMGDAVFDCGYGCGDEYPAHSVSWNDAAEFMNRLTERENELLGDGKERTLCYEKDGGTWTWGNRNCTGYRLPTETEWEYVARAGTTTAYSFGSKPTELDAYVWSKRSSGNETHPVREKKPNVWGLYDVHGNVREWVWDWYAQQYPSVQTPIGYAGPESGDTHVMRGGSFEDPSRLIRSASRNRAGPGLTSEFVGFRCVQARTSVIWIKTTPLPGQ